MFSWRETRTFFLLLWLMLAIVSVLIVGRFMHFRLAEEVIIPVVRIDFHNPRVAGVSIASSLLVNPVSSIQEPKTSIFASSGDEADVARNPSVYGAFFNLKALGNNHSSERVVDSDLPPMNVQSSLNPSVIGVCGVDITCVPF